MVYKDLNTNIYYECLINHSNVFSLREKKNDVQKVSKGSEFSIFMFL